MTLLYSLIFCFDTHIYPLFLLHSVSYSLHVHNICSTFLLYPLVFVPFFFNMYFLYIVYYVSNSPFIVFFYVLLLINLITLYVVMSFIYLLAIFCCEASQVKNYTCSVVCQYRYNLTDNTHLFFLTFLNL